MFSPGFVTPSAVKALEEMVRRVEASQRLQAAAPFSLARGYGGQPSLSLDLCLLRAMMLRSDCGESGTGAGQAVVDLPVVTDVECASGGGIVQTTTTYRLRIDFVAQTAEVEVL